MNNQFKCRYCQSSYLFDKLAGTIQNEKEIQTLTENIERYQQKRADLVFRAELTEESKQQKDQKWEIKIKEGWTQIKSFGDILICELCWNRAKKKAKKQQAEITTFACTICQEIKESKLFKIHVANKLDQGIEPRKISQICQYCYTNEIIPADYYCPLTSDGRTDWDLGKPKYDCWCPTNPTESTEYLTIEGETVKQIKK